MGEFTEIPDQMHLVKIANMVCDGCPGCLRLFFVHAVSAGKSYESRKVFGRKTNPFFTNPLELTIAEAGQGCNLINTAITTGLQHYLHGLVKWKHRLLANPLIEEKKFHQAHHFVESVAMLQLIDQLRKWPAKKISRIKTFIHQFMQGHTQQMIQPGRMKTYPDSQVLLVKQEINRFCLGTYDDRSGLWYKIPGWIDLSTNRIPQVKEQGILRCGWVKAGSCRIRGIKNCMYRHDAVNTVL